MMEKRIHPTEIPHFEGRMLALVDFVIGKLRYDRVAELHRMLAERYLAEAQQELARGRVRLAWRLEKMANAEKHAASEMLKVWQICEPHSK